MTMWIILMAMLAGAVVMSCAACQHKLDDAIGVVTYGSAGPETLEFRICPGDTLGAAALRIEDDPDSAALFGTQYGASTDDTRAVTISFGPENATNGNYSPELAMTQVRGFEDAILGGRRVSGVSVETLGTYFSAGIPDSLPAGSVLVIDGGNAENTGKLKVADRRAADAVFNAACAG